MKTTVIMKRQFINGFVSQDSKTEMLSATDLENLGNKYRFMNDLKKFSLKSYFNNASTKEFMAELNSQFGEVNVKRVSRGKDVHTWVHPLLFIDIALAISPTLKIEAYKWLLDHLIESRNRSGDSYNLMCGSLYNRWGNKSTFKNFIVNVARLIKDACGVSGSDWQHATEEQLVKRNEIHKEIALLCEVLQDCDTAVRVAIARASGQPTMPIIIK